MSSSSSRRGLSAALIGVAAVAALGVTSATPASAMARESTLAAQVEQEILPTPDYPNADKAKLTTTIIVRNHTRETLTLGYSQIGEGLAVDPAFDSTWIRKPTIGEKIGSYGERTYEFTGNAPWGIRGELWFGLRTEPYPVTIETRLYGPNRGTRRVTTPQPFNHELKSAVEEGRQVVIYTLVNP